MMFDPGRYYVGDLCYVLGDRWDEFCDLTIKDSDCLDGTFKFDDGTIFWTHHTAYGDGSYYDRENRRYAVDAGLIGVVAQKDIDSEPSYLEGGQIIEFKTRFEPYYRDGCFYIGDVIIDTAGENEEYDQYEYEEDE